MFNTCCVRHPGRCADVRCDECPYRDPRVIVTNTPRPSESAEQTAARTAARGDKVVLPDHYARFKIEPITFICENKLDFFQGNIVKYVCRHDAKNGIEDLRKAKRYLEMYIKYLQDDSTWPAK